MSSWDEASRHTGDIVLTTRAREASDPKERWRGCRLKGGMWWTVKMAGLYIVVDNHPHACTFFFFLAWIVLNC